MKVRTKTIISIISAFVFISIALGITYYAAAADRFRQEAEKNLNLLSKSYADQIDMQLENYSRVVRDYASQVLVATYIPDLFQESKRVYPELGQFFYTSLDGQVAEVFPYKEEWMSQDFSQYEFWNRALVTEELVLTVDEQSFGEPVLVFSLPIISYFLIESAPSLHGILCVTLPLDRFFDEYEDIRVGTTGSLLILDNNTVIRSHSMAPSAQGTLLKEWGGEGIEPLLPWLGGEHFGTASFSKGNERYFASFYPIKTNDWTLLLIQTVDELTQSMRNTVILIVVVFLISVVLAILIASFSLNRITRPLNENLHILKDIAEGRGDFKGLKSIASHDEFEELSDYFQKIFSRMDEVARNLDVDLQKERMERNKTLSALEDTQKRFKAIFHHTYQLMFLINPEGRIVEVNDSLLRFTGDNRFNLIDTLFWQTRWWAFAEDEKRIQGAVLQALKGQFVREEFQIREKDGIHTMDFTFKPIRNNDTVAMLIVEGRDITLRKTMEQELEAHRSRLEELVEEKTTELKAAQAELIKQGKFATLGKLTAVVSHEIRNPLATIRSSSFVMKRKLKNGDESMTKVLDRIERNVRRCDTIIEDLLSYTRETKLENRDTDIDAWVATFEEAFSSDDQETEIRFQLQSHAKASLDTERFRRVIINLVENAQQAFDQGEPDQGRSPEIIVRTERQGDQVLISVIDNGTGISEENKEKIFEPLFSTKSFGIGLGLPIVVQLIEKHNGTLSVDSTLGKGTVFTVSLPAVS